LAKEEAVVEQRGDGEVVIEWSGGGGREVWSFFGFSWRWATGQRPQSTKPGVAADVILVHPGLGNKIHAMQHTGDRTKKACPFIFRDAGKFFFPCPMVPRFLS
jgi:hypothetical protein